MAKGNKKPRTPLQIKSMEVLNAKRKADRIGKKLGESSDEYAEQMALHDKLLNEKRAMLAEQEKEDKKAKTPVHIPDNVIEFEGKLYIEQDDKLIPYNPEPVDTREYTDRELPDGRILRIYEDGEKVSIDPLEHTKADYRLDADDVPESETHADKELIEVYLDKQYADFVGRLAIIFAAERNMKTAMSKGQVIQRLVRQAWAADPTKGGMIEMREGMAIRNNDLTALKG